MTPEELFNSNKKLVYYTYNKYFNSEKNSFYKEEILQEGMLYLWKACIIFDPSKEIKFSTFAVNIIYNRMLEYISRKLVKHSKNISLETIVLADREGNTCTLQDILPAKDAFESIDLKIIFWECFGKLSKREQEIVLLAYQGHPQRHIANKYNLSQAQVSRIIKKFKKKIKGEIQ